MAAAASSLIGRVIDGSYRIDALLGQGAVGAVYRATEQQSGRILALKQWHSGNLDDQVRGRFLREAKALNTLDHPNIVRVFGHGFVDGVPYVALEYLEGQTLESVLKGEPLPSDLAFEIARQALDAIAYAHALDVVHRDIKPENLFLARDRNGKLRVKILDYGLAKFMTPSDDPTSDVALTMTGMVMGTPLYMPPEQAAGSSVDVGVDVYAMGCVLCEMLTGRPPYLGESHLELLAAHLRSPIPKLENLRRGVRFAPELQALIERALAKRQTERFPDAGAMREALDRIPQPALLSQGPAALDAAAQTSATESSRSSLLGLVVLAAVVLVGGLAFALMR